MNSFSQISVIIPVYNCDQYLAQAIESVLKQTHQPLEIIVVDDASTDNSAAVAQSFGNAIRYELQPNSGAAIARNRGAELANGGLLAFLDADDLWSQDKLALQMAAFEQNPELSMVFGQIKQFHSPELDQSTKQKIYCPSQIMPGYHPGTMIVKKEAFERVGEFSTNWEVGEFIDWYSRAMELGLSSLMLSDVVYKRRLHQTNMGIYKRQSRVDYARILKASLDRRRRLAAQTN